MMDAVEIKKNRGLFITFVTINNLQQTFILNRFILEDNREAKE